MRKVVIVSLSLQPPGGGGGVGAWTAQALCQYYDVTALTWQTYDAIAIDRYYGTQLVSERIRGISPPRWLQHLMNALPVKPLVHFQLNVLLRMLRSRLHLYDLAISTHNEMDLGRRGLQYIHNPREFDNEQHVSHAWRTNPLLRALLGAYRGLCRLLSGATKSGVMCNFTLANSRFVADRVFTEYGMHARVVHPPVTGISQAPPWEKRADEFLCVGRICPAKEMDKVMRILDRVRARGHAVRLHLVGNREEPRYFARIMGMARERAEWVSFHDTPSRARLGELIGRCRYGIHGMTQEHFGMVVAEMVRGGCIVFVPDDGGQVDIVGDRRLTYRDEADAAAKIVEVLESAALQRELSQHLQGQAEMFSSERFMQEMRQAVEACLRE